VRKDGVSEVESIARPHFKLITLRMSLKSLKTVMSETFNKYFVVVRLLFANNAWFKTTTLRRCANNSDAAIYTF